RRAGVWLVAPPVSARWGGLVAEGQSNRMLSVAEPGTPSGAITDFSLARDDASHPLIDALNSPEPVHFEDLPIPHRGPLAATAFHAIPLRSDAQEPGQGLLLVAGPRASLDAEAAWMGRMLGKQVSRLLGRQLL